MRNGKKSDMPTIHTSPSIITNQVAHGHRQWDGKDLGVGMGRGCEEDGKSGGI